MSSISDIAKCSDAAANKPSRVQDFVARWLMFSDYGAAAHRHMVIVWFCVLGCAFASAAWLPNSRFSFASSNWNGLLLGIACCALAGAFIAKASSRLWGDTRPLAAALRAALSATELLWRAALPIGALLVAGVTLSYLITSTAMPLQDALLVRIDRHLGFDWLRFLNATNSSPFLAASLARAYDTISPVVEWVIVWLALNQRGERLTEFMAILSVSTVGLCVGMWLIPAAGAFAYHDPAPQLVANIFPRGEMWPFADTFTMLRNGSLSVIDLSALQGVVSFPSFHTMLGVMTLYALRDTRWLMILVLLLNGSMFVSTLPVGGHHLADVLAGVGITSGAIFLVGRIAGPGYRPIGT